MDIIQNTKTSKEKDDIISIKESFYQLGKLQEECNQELSRYQRENFIVHEEFRATIAHLSEMMDNFSTIINGELDKLSLRISHLETIAIYAFNLVSTPILIAPGAVTMSCTSQRIYLGFNDGLLQSYSIPSLDLACEITKQKYDLLDTYGKITQIYASEKNSNHLYIGFFSGTLIFFHQNFEDPVKMLYHHEPITALSVSDEFFASGDNSGVVCLWNADNGQRLMIIPDHRLAIASIFSLSNDWIFADRTGIISIHNRTCSLTKGHYSLNKTLRYLFPHHDNQMISIGDELLIWEGKNIVKTFNAVPIGHSIVCCKKQPELMLIGSKTSTEMQLIFMDSLLFPKKLDVIDSPPIAILDFSSFFYVLTQTGKLYIIRPSV